VLVKAASLAVLAVHDPICPDADLLHPLPQRIQHGLRMADGSGPESRLEAHKRWSAGSDSGGARGL
jgi:hypothetical protein